ncbi:DUF3267 domain-containing protein [Natronomonas sp. CBA1123]|uniref:DUF3267 domain-containing protein n=1 Tax=Natronomonas sp. CBA1123 TaxID=2668070 RepID=UPI0012EA26C3|nr:DUF3267 domain-containing protein [Natronomonas sp. CBA1123]MUV85092.1 DUF3267 domain-containing protein [Natronomonas sp. CBA1123]
MSTSESFENVLAEYTLSRSLALQWTAVSTMGFIAGLFGFVGVYYLATGDSTAFAFGIGSDAGWWNAGLSILAFLALVFGIIVPHELVHGLAMRLYGGRPRYSVGLAYFVFPYAYATAEDRFTRNQFLVITLAPLVVLTLLGTPVMVGLELPWLAVPLAANVGGAVGDVWMALTLLGYPSTVSVLDTRTGLAVYGRPEEAPSSSNPSPLRVVWDVLLGTGAAALAVLIVGIVVPLVLGVTGVGSIRLGIPNSPLFLFAYETSADGFAYSVGPLGLVVAPVVGLMYAFMRSRGRQQDSS